MGRHGQMDPAEHDPSALVAQELIRGGLFLRFSTGSFRKGNGKNGRKSQNLGRFSELFRQNRPLDTDAKAQPKNSHF